MNIIGKWKVKKVICPTENGIEFRDVTDIPDDEENEELRQLARFIIEFKADGTVDTLIPVDVEALTEENCEQMRAEGHEIIDGLVKIESTTWEERNGVPYYNTGANGEFMGEEVDSFAKIEFEGENMLFNGGMILLERR